MDLTVVLTQDQYDRYKTAYKNMQGMTEDPTEDQLTRQLKREAMSITYNWEVSMNSADPSTWTF